MYVRYVIALDMLQFCSPNEKKTHSFLVLFDDDDDTLFWQNGWPSKCVQPQSNHSPPFSFSPTSLLNLEIVQVPLFNQFPPMYCFFVDSPISFKSVFFTEPNNIEAQLPPVQKGGGVGVAHYVSLISRQDHCQKSSL